jgi:hypothetical protein
MSGHEVVWTQPPVFAAGAAAALIPTAADAFDTPALLRFTNDAFMDEFLNLLATEPSRLRDYRVRRETWRGFTPTPPVEAPRPVSLVRQRLGILPRRLPSSSAAATATALAEPPAVVPSAAPLKLYQPAHQRYYLVASSLVCRVTGLPDRAIEAGRGEAVACVIRRLLPPAGGASLPVEQWDEHAWVANVNGFAWQAVGGTPSRLLDGEERLPLFAVHFAENSRRSRRLFAGVVPVGRREAYLGAPKSNGGTTPGVTSRTARKILLRKEVIEPWKALVKRALDVRRSFAGPFAGSDRAPSTTEKAARLKIEREQIQTVSWFILLDFAKYLSSYLKPVWRAVLDPSRRSQLTPPEEAVFDALTAIAPSATLRERVRYQAEVTSSGAVLYASGDVAQSLRQALAQFGAAPDALDSTLERQLDALDVAYDRHDANSRAAWPRFLFPLADPDLPNDAPLPSIAIANLTTDEQLELALDENPVAGDPLERLDTLAVLVVRALRDDATEPAPQPAVPTAAIQPANALEGWFVIRCAYERPACEPARDAVVSERTEPFQMAGFFDPDAPARPIRIGLPIDTTPAGLRKFDKNTAFVISDTLCGQIRRMKGLTFGDLIMSVLPWPLHKDLPGGESGPCKTDTGLSIGMICSISIPIITLCALILLMVVVALLDIVFRWLPYFIICFPIPGLKAKKT